MSREFTDRDCETGGELANFCNTLRTFEESREKTHAVNAKCPMCKVAFALADVVQGVLVESWRPL